MPLTVTQVQRGLQRGALVERDGAGLAAARVGSGLAGAGLRHRNAHQALHGGQPLNTPRRGQTHLLARARGLSAGAGVHQEELEEGTALSHAARDRFQIIYLDCVSHWPCSVSGQWDGDERRCSPQLQRVPPALPLPYYTDASPIGTCRPSIQNLHRSMNFLILIAPLS